MQQNELLAGTGAEKKTRVVRGFCHAEPEKVLFALHLAQDVWPLGRELQALRLQVLHAFYEAPALGAGQLLDQKVLYGLAAPFLVKTNTPAQYN